MIFVVLACVVARNRLQGKLSEKALGIAIIAVVIAGMTVITAGSIPVVEIPTSPNQELRVMPPTAFPLTMQQHRDYDSNQFYYRIVLGWPDGIPIYEGVATDDQSEFIHFTHLYMIVLLGEYLAVGTMMVLAVVLLLELRRRNQDQNETSDFNVNYMIKLFIPVAIFSISLTMFLFPEVLPFLPSHIIFAVGFWGLFVGLGVYILFLFTPKSRRQQYAKNES